METEKRIFKQLRFTKGGFENFANETFDLWQALVRSDKFSVDKNFAVLNNDGKITGLLLQSIDDEDFSFAEDRILLIKLAKNGMISGRQVLIEKCRDKELNYIQTFFYLVDIKRNRSYFELPASPIVDKDGLDQDSASFIELGLLDLDKSVLDIILSKQINNLVATEYVKERFPELNF